MREPGSSQLKIATAVEMQALGVALGAALREHHGRPLLVAITGELGVGKTVLVGGILNAFGTLGPVRSPTYTLIEPYVLLGRPIYHLDLYRLNDAAEIEALGVRDLFDTDALLLVEWPERAAGVLPPADVAVEISYDYQAVARAVRISGSGPAGVAIVQSTQDKFSSGSANPSA